MDLLCKCLWKCEGQMTLFGQKFPRTWNGDSVWKIILSQDIWWAAVSGLKQLFRSYHQHGHTASTKLSLKALHLKCHLVLFTLIGI